MMMRVLMIALALVVHTAAFAQMPTNDEKEYEYYGEMTVRRAGTGDVQKRLAHWANVHFDEAKSLVVVVDDTTKRYVEIDVIEPMVESHFGVKRTHSNRALAFHIKFDAERKDYKYWITDFKYSALEVDHKNREVQLEGKMSEMSSAAKKSLEEEVDMLMQDIIKSFTEAAETELPEDE